MNNSIEKIDLLDGKYTFVIEDNGKAFYCLRYGSAWIPEFHNIAGSRATFALCSELIEARQKLASPAIMAIIDERKNQTDAEGYDTKHDDKYKAGELIAAALCYVKEACYREIFQESYKATFGQNAMWPWPLQFWKPKSKRRDLVRAAALIVAELERMDRAGEGQ